MYSQIDQISNVPYSQYRTVYRIRHTTQWLPHTTAANFSMALVLVRPIDRWPPCHRQRWPASLIANRPTGAYARMLVLQVPDLHVRPTHIANYTKEHCVQRQFESNGFFLCSFHHKTTAYEFAFENAPVGYIEIWKHFQLNNLIGHIEKCFRIHFVCWSVLSRSPRIKTLMFLFFVRSSTELFIWICKVNRFRRNKLIGSWNF